MNKSRYYVFIAAAAAFACLCGIFFYPAQITTENETLTASTENKSPAFSLDEACNLLSLCSLSYEAENLQTELLQQGYTDFEYFERNQTSHSGSGIAAGIAHAEDKIIIIFRGTNKGEWYSNFSIGEGEEHQGFSAASDFSIESISDYVNHHNLDSKKYSLLITGHSRGGAVANICAKRFTDKNTFQSISAYTFASPCTTTSPNAENQLYNNIYNIINPEDFICYIPLSQWNYCRYGIDIPLPQGEKKENKSLYEDMQSKFLLLTGYNHTGYPSGHEDVEKFLSAAAKIAPTVSDYYNKEIPLYPNSITLYEYMENAATLLSGEKSLSKGMILLSGSVSPKFHPITRFMLQGIRIEDLTEDSSITHSAIGCAHTYETYQAWLDVLDEDYFYDTIKNNDQV